MRYEHHTNGGLAVSLIFNLISLALSIRGATQKFGEFKRRPKRLSYALLPLDVASIMLCESVCQQL